MPELPEVETIKRYLEKAIVGKKIKEIAVLSKKQFPSDPRQIIGLKITGLKRRAKLLIICLEKEKNLVVHLKLSGQLVWVDKVKKLPVKLKANIPFAGEALPAKTTRVIISIGEGKLFFNEMRKFGWMKVFSNSQLEKETERIGPEPFAKEFSENHLKGVFEKTAKPVKAVLLDQNKIAGIGNIYANESLFLAKINPLKPAKELNSKEISGLRRNILTVLKLGIKYEGASDIFNVKPDGAPGRFQEHFFVYRRDGKKCLKCGAVIKRISIGGRGTFFCPKCQK